MQVQLVFLYGPPGVGNYTVAVELAARTGFRLLHNHLTLNLVSAVFERDSDVWLGMLRKVWRDLLTEVAHHNVNLIGFLHWHGRWRLGISSAAAATHQLQQMLQRDVWLTRQSDRLVSMLLSTAT